MIERIEWWPSGWNGTRGHETGNRPAYSIRLRRELPPATVSQSSAVVVAVVVHRKRKERSDDDYGLRWESLNRHPLSSPAIVHRKRKERSDDPPSPKRFRLRLRASADKTADKTAWHAITRDQPSPCGLRPGARLRMTITTEGEARPCPPKGFEGHAAVPYARPPTRSSRHACGDARNLHSPNRPFFTLEPLAAPRVHSRA